MKLFFLFCCIIIFLSCNGCRSFYSPVGEWELYTNRNNKFEELMIPVTTMTIHADGKFICSTLEGGKYETNAGVWKQKGKTIVFNDHTGEHCALMEGENRIIIKEQPLKKFGIQMLYIRKSQNAIIK